MSLSFPFPTGLYRAIGEGPVAVVAHDEDGRPTVVCVSATTAFERVAALVLLSNHPESFVISEGQRFFPDGHIETADPTRPCYAGELHLHFDVEWVALGPQPEVYVFTHTEQEWEAARQAMKHLLQLGRVSPCSYLEGDHAGFDQGLSAQNLDGKPHGPGLVALFREAAICAQNEEERQTQIAGDLFSLLEESARKRADEEEDEGWEGYEEEWFDEEEREETASEEEWEDEIPQEVSVQTDRSLRSLVRWIGTCWRHMRRSPRS
jgi:hypothetical protein